MSSLVELIVLIGLLGFLAAQVMPRFVDLRDEAEFAQVQGTAAAIESAVNHVPIIWSVNKHPTRVQDLQGFGDDDVDTNNIGFPIGTNKGSGNENIGKQRAGCVMLWDGLMISHPSVSLNNDGADYQAYRHTQNKVCSYVYRAGGDTRNRRRADLVIKYDSRDGTVVVCGAYLTLQTC